MPFEIIRNDITKLQVDAIVNAINREFQLGGGVCGAIFSAAGAEKLQKACDKIGNCEVGKAVVTKGYSLPSKYIIHTVGPVWRGGNYDEYELLYACYKNSLELAKEKDCESIAFPLISSGTYGYPKDQALRVAVTAIRDFLLQNDMLVYLVVFDKAAFSLSEKLHSAIKSFIDNNYVDSQPVSRKRSEKSELLTEATAALQDADFSIGDTAVLTDELLKPAPMKERKIKQQAPVMAPQVAQRSLNDALAHLDETFSQRLLRLIDERQRSDTEVYKRANIDRRVFSRIRSNKDYRPSKNTVLAFAISLELSLDDTRDLLMKAGFALSRSNKLDVIVEYFITEKNYNIFEINEALFAFDQNLLGA